MASLSMHFAKVFWSRTIHRHYKSILSPCYAARRQFSCTSFAFNSQRRYGEKHEWVTVDGNIGTVGITHYAQESLGDVVYVQLPEIDFECEADTDVGVIESVKAVNELCSPISGRVTEVNTELENNPGLLNKACYDEGWIFKLEMKNVADVEKLMDEKQYDEYLKSME